jgi:hypothetical protein
MGFWSYCMLLYIVILLTFLVRMWCVYFSVSCFFYIVDFAHVEWGYILNLRYSNVEFNFVS